LDALNGKDGGNRLAVFGPKMSELVRKIKANEKKFKKMPKGPIGAYVTVKVGGLSDFSRICLEIECE
jgi:hypothetical protein